MNDRFAPIPPRGTASGHAPRWTAILAGVALLATLITPLVARADDQDTIDYREHIMSTMGDQMVLIGQILQKKAPADDLAVYAQILAMTATTAKSAFMPNVAGGKAKPNVWTAWPDFSKRLDELVVSTADLAKAAKTGDTAAVGSKATSLGCKGCHDTYRQPLKK